MQGLVLLLNAIDVGKGISQDLRLFERPRANLGMFLNTRGRDGLLEGNKFGVHVGAVALLDDVMGGTLGSIPHLRVLAAR